MSFPRYPAYKASGVEWLGEVPAHWEITRLGYFSSKIGSGKTPSGGADAYADEGVLFIRSQNVLDEGLNLEDAVFISTQTDGEMAGSRVLVGDVLLNITGASLGRSCLVRDLPTAANVNQHVCIVRLASADFRGYVAFALQSPNVKSQFDYAQNGAAREGLNYKQVAGIALPLPPASEAHAIADFLAREVARIDALVAEQQRLIELLKEKRQAVISHAVTKGLDPNAKMKPSGIEWLGDVPTHWAVVKMKYVAKMESGHTPDKKVAEYWIDGDIPWVSLNDTTHLKDNDYISDTAYQITQLGIDNSSAHLLPERAVVFSRDATIGRCAITTRPMAVSQHFIAWVCGEQILPEYLLLRLRSMTFELDRLTTGATLKTIGMPEVRTLVTPLPPVREQVAIVDRVKSQTKATDSLIAEAEQAITLLQERRAALISAAVTGQIDVTRLPKATA